MPDLLSYSRWGRARYETEQSTNNEKKRLNPLIDIRPDHSDAELIVVHSKQKVNERLLDAVPSAKVILTTTSGYDHLDLTLIKSRGIQVARMPLIRANAVVETTLGLILFGLRRFGSLRHYAEQGIWAREQLPVLHLSSLRGSSIGVVGSEGVIGQKMVQVLELMGANVLKCDSALQESATVEEIRDTCSVVTLHCNLNPTSVGLLSEEWFQGLNHPIGIVNTARGGLLNEQAALDALDDGRISFLGLDVFETEPCMWLKAQKGRKEILLLPHAAGFYDGLLNEIALGIESVILLFQTGVLLHEL